jgi:hypothetical protein
MTIIQWIKQGGRRYVQLSAAGASTVGQAWTSVGSGGAAPISSVPYRTLVGVGT